MHRVLVATSGLVRVPPANGDAADRIQLFEGVLNLFGYRTGAPGIVYFSGAGLSILVCGGKSMPLHWPTKGGHPVEHAGRKSGIHARDFDPLLQTNQRRVPRNDGRGNTAQPAGRTIAANGMARLRPTSTQFRATLSFLSSSGALIDIHVAVLVGVNNTQTSNFLTVPSRVVVTAVKGKDDVRP